MEYLKDGKNYVVRLERGEDLNASLEDFMIKEDLSSAFFKGLGALEDVELGYYDLPQKTYLKRLFPEEAELLVAMGNLTFKEGQPYAHIHAVLSGKDFLAYGGHVFRAKVSVTAELFVECIDHQIERKMNDQVGLQLMNCRI
tara:strand:- start:1997 stop:2422 length:426 start_codon:yes stop_codon:yes gene_type:complete